MSLPPASNVASVPRESAADHAWANEALPWYVNGTLDERQAPRLEQHLSQCDECRAQLALNRLLCAQIGAEPGIELAPQAGLAAVLRRIETRESWRRRLARPLQALFGERAQRPLALAVAIQALVIVMLTGVLGYALRPAPQAQYRTLATSQPARTGVAADPAAPLLRLVLADEMSVGELRELLAPWKGRIVAGPEGRDIYTVAIEGAPADALRAFRAHAGIRLAEPITAP